MITLDELVEHKTWRDYKYTWQEELGKQFDEMVDSFLDFPPGTPQDYKDQQFARHLLWKLQDCRSFFVRLFMKGIVAYELDCLWVRLLPYITGDFPENISPLNKKLVKFSRGMFLIVQETTTKHDVPFDDLLKQTTKLISEVRNVL